MQLFYSPHLDPRTTEASFPKDESKHIVKVLRKKVGDVLDLTDGKGFFYKAELIHATPGNCKAKILDSTAAEPLPYRLHIAVAPTKTNDRFEFFLEKATEIGITSITPLFCDHSERKVIKQERYLRILESAMKQSLKAYLPKLNKAVPFEEFIRNAGEGYDQLFIAHCDEDEKFSLKERLLPKKDTLILIGPEGDFSPSEIQLALNKRFVPVSLGSSRLRTETAAIAAVHSVAFVNSDPDS